MTTRQRKALESLWDHYVVELSDSLTLGDIFATGPITLEIGFGMGASLAEMALQQPEMNFLGVEVHRPGVGSLLADIEERGLSNVRIICADVVEVLHHVIPANSLDRILIFFPDPWHKKRHHKRRLVQVDLVKRLEQCLRPQGILHLATDWANYAEHMQAVMLELSSFKQLPEHTDPRPQTKFERRGLRLGHDVYDLVYRLEVGSLSPGI